jgi:hypothetical protein
VTGPYDNVSGSARCNEESTRTPFLSVLVVLGDEISLENQGRVLLFGLPATLESRPMGGSVALGPGLELRTSQLSPRGGRDLFRVVRDGQTAALVRGADGPRAVTAMIRR